MFVAITPSPTGQRYRLTVFAPPFPQLEIAIAQSDALGRPYLQLGSRRINDAAALDRYFAEVMRLTEQFFSANWPQPATPPTPETTP